MMKLQSPAKLNLFLRVLGKRPDGYHELASLFQTIDLFDEITLTLSPKDRFTCSDPSLLLDENNLVMKALKLFREKTNVNFCAEIHLEKRIPIQAGLGGGSGNAATTLWGLNELTGRQATLDQLVAWAGELGSDVPFFLTCGTAYCTGRGEVMRPLEPLDRKQAFIVKPAVGLSTPTVFRNYNAQTVTQRDPEMQLKGFLEKRGTYFNDLEEPAFSLLPLLQHLKSDLQKGGFETVCMTGSGTALFCLGHGNLPNVSDLFVKKVQFINRLQDQWYR